MADVQAVGGMIDIVVKGITIILLIVAGWLAIKKNNNLALGVAVIGNLAAYYFTQSPLLCWIVSIACMIWAGMTKVSGQKETDLKVSKNKLKADIGDMGGKVKLKCRFCKKLYDADYNGCPYCKKV